MDAVCDMVVNKYDGSLKAEHGTGRNMAPFVELEWGGGGLQLMAEIKSLFDPECLLNPGRAAQRRPHRPPQELQTDAGRRPAVDACMECGFCEPFCPSNGLTLTPRQRIVGWREVARLSDAGDDPAGGGAAPALRL